jgi:hypothetical protein
MLYNIETTIDSLSLLSGKMNPAKKQGLSFTFPTGFLYNPLWRIGKPISVGASHFGGSANRFRLELSTLADPSAEFG